jgi:hypothetical protein
VPVSVERHSTIVEVTLSGFIAIIDLSDIAGALDDIDRATPGLNRLVDTSGVTGVGLGFTTMMRFAEERARWSPAEHVRTAIVAPSDQAFGFGRMFQELLQQRITVRVFRDRGEALEWLGLPDTQDTVSTTR